MPDYTIETEHGGRVAGVDEVGRGPLAGPVVAAAVVFPAGLPAGLAVLLDDSKKLTAEQRGLAYSALLLSGLAQIGVGAASVAEISRINILRASLLAMQRAISRLPVTPDLALVDGNQPPALPCPVRCVVGGDGLSLSIAAASHRGQGGAGPGDGAAGGAAAALWLGDQCRLCHGGASGGDHPARPVAPPPAELWRRAAAFGAS